MTLRVRQLLYTNVEAPQSPTNQRGFQVWRCSPNLDAVARKIVEERVKDFRLPARTRPETPGIVRHAAFPVLDGCAVVRTVPLSEPDKFGRGGRFFAHAVILAADEFQQLGCDPYTVLDRFPFLTRPEVTAGQRPPAEFEGDELFDPATPPGAAAADSRPLPAKFDDLLAHLTGLNPLPVLIAAPPAEVLGVVRALLRVLPPSRRKEFAFDTLAGGAFAAGSSVVGGYSTETLKTWPSKKHVLYDPGAGTAKPALTSRTRDLPLRLFTAPGWLDLADHEREMAHDVAIALDANRAPGVRKLSLRAGEVLEAAGARVAVERLVEQTIADKVPAAFRTLDAVGRAVTEHFGASLAEVVNGLGLAIPATAVTAGLVAALASGAAARPSPAVLDAVRDWLKQFPQSDWKLKYVVARWQANEDELLKLRNELRGEPNERRVWLRKWLPSTLPASVQTGDPAQLARLLPATRKPLSIDPREALLRAATEERPEDEAWREVRLRAAYHLPGEFFATELDATGPSEGFRARALLTAEAVAASGVPTWYQNDGDLLLGIFCRSDSTDPARTKLLDAAERDLATYVVDEFRTLRQTPREPFEARYIKTPTRAGKVGSLCEAVLRPGAEPRTLATHKKNMAEALKQGTDDDYKWAGRQLHDLVCAERYFAPRTGGWLVGLSLRTRKMTHEYGYQYLYGALARAVGPGMYDDGAPDSLERYWWLYDLFASTLPPEIRP